MPSPGVDWSTLPVFGTRPEVGVCALRPSAYTIVEDRLRRLALVRTHQGIFLPGGGINFGETPQQTAIRESLEECGLPIRPGPWLVRAVQFVYSEPEQTHFEKRSTFIDATFSGPIVPAHDPDHELLWVDTETSARTLSHESHRWAVAQWSSRLRLPS